METIILDSKTYHTNGILPKVGSKAPDFTVTKTDLSEIHLKNYLGKSFFIISSFPSLDTPICANAMEKFNQIADTHKNVMILCISADLPFAQKRFCSAQHPKNVQPVSVFRHASFPENYGIKIIDGPLQGLLARAIILIDEKGIVRYTELVSQITEEPNYEKLLQFIS